MRALWIALCVVACSAQGPTETTAIDTVVHSPKIRGHDTSVTLSPTEISQLNGTWVSDGDTSEMINPYVCGPGGYGGPQPPPPDTGLFTEPPAITLIMVDTSNVLTVTETGPYMCNQYGAPDFLTFGTSYSWQGDTLYLVSNTLGEGAGGCNNPTGGGCGSGESFQLVYNPSTDSIAVVSYVGQYGPYLNFKRHQ